MKLCPFCAEEIQDAAIRCKHCRSDLVAPASRPPAIRSGRGVRLVLGGLTAVLVLAVGGPVVARPVLHQLRRDRCEPSNWVEWHLAMHRQCLTPSYVCEHMTTPKMLQDPDIARSFRGDGAIGDPAHLADLVGRMRHAFGCAPESGPAFRSEPGPIAPPAFPIAQDPPSTL